MVIIVVFSFLHFCWWSCVICSKITYRWIYLAISVTHTVTLLPVLQYISENRLFNRIMCIIGQPDSHTGKQWCNSYTSTRELNSKPQKPLLVVAIESFIHSCVEHGIISSISNYVINLRSCSRTPRQQCWIKSTYL